jgi:hypothetical protein
MVDGFLVEIQVEKRYSLVPMVIWEQRPWVLQAKEELKKFSLQIWKQLLGNSLEWMKTCGSARVRESALGMTRELMKGLMKELIKVKLLVEIWL